MLKKTINHFIATGSAAALAGCSGSAFDLGPGSVAMECENNEGSATVTRIADPAGGNLVIRDDHGNILHRSQQTRSIGMLVFDAKDYCASNILPAIAEEKTYAQGYGYSCRGHIGPAFTTSTNADRVSVSSEGQIVATYKREDIMRARHVTERLCEGDKPKLDFQL